MNDVDVPEGMVFVGYYCQHGPLNPNSEGVVDWRKPYTPHRAPFYKTTPKYKADRGWDDTHSTVKSFSFPDFREGDAERHCQYRVPVFVRAADLEDKREQH